MKCMGGTGTAKGRVYIIVVYVCAESIGGEKGSVKE